MSEFHEAASRSESVDDQSRRLSFWTYKLVSRMLQLMSLVSHLVVVAVARVWVAVVGDALSRLVVDRG